MGPRIDGRSLPTGSTNTSRKFTALRRRGVCLRRGKRPAEWEWRGAPVFRHRPTDRLPRCTWVR